MQEFNEILKLLGGEHGWAAAALSWMASARLVFKPFAALVETAFNRGVIFVLDSEEKDDDELLLKLLCFLPYRLLAFAIDMLVSVKLPTKKSVSELLRKLALQNTPPANG